MDENKPLHPKLAHPKPNFLEHFIELATQASLILSMPNVEEAVRQTAGPRFFDAVNKEVASEDLSSYNPKP